MRLSFVRECIGYNLAMHVSIRCINEVYSVDARARFPERTWQNAQAVYTNVKCLLTIRAW